MLDENQLSHFRERQTASLMDTCHIMTHSSSRNTYKETIDVYTEVNTDVPCGLEQKVGGERQRDKDTVVSYDAILRLAITVSITEKDRIKITKRYGESITAIIYSIVSPIQRGPSGIRLQLKKVDL